VTNATLAEGGCGGDGEKWVVRSLENVVAVQPVTRKSKLYIVWIMSNWFLAFVAPVQPFPCG
jgi:hypothetical protein